MSSKRGSTITSGGSNQQSRSGSSAQMNHNNTGGGQHTYYTSYSDNENLTIFHRVSKHTGGTAPYNHAGGMISSHTSGSGSRVHPMQKNMADHLGAADPDMYGDVNAYYNQHLLAQQHLNMMMHPSTYGGQWYGSWKPGSKNDGNNGYSHHFNTRDRSRSAYHAMQHDKTSTSQHHQQNRYQDNRCYDAQTSRPPTAKQHEGTGNYINVAGSASSASSTTGNTNSSNTNNSTQNQNGNSDNKMLNRTTAIRSGDVDQQMKQNEIMPGLTVSSAASGSSTTGTSSSSSSQHSRSHVVPSTTAITNGIVHVRASGSGSGHQIGSTATHHQHKRDRDYRNNNLHKTFRPQPGMPLQPIGSSGVHVQTVQEGQNQKSQSNTIDNRVSMKAASSLRTNITNGTSNTAQLAATNIVNPPIFNPITQPTSSSAPLAPLKRKKHYGGGKKSSTRGLPGTYSDAGDHQSEVGEDSDVEGPPLRKHASESLFLDCARTLWKTNQVDPGKAKAMLDLRSGGQKGDHLFARREINKPSSRGSTSSQQQVDMSVNLLCPTSTNTTQEPMSGKPRCDSDVSLMSVKTGPGVVMVEESETNHNANMHDEVMKMNIISQPGAAVITSSEEQEEGENASDNNRDHRAVSFGDESAFDLLSKGEMEDEEHEDSKEHNALNQSTNHPIVDVDTRNSHHGNVRHDKPAHRQRSKSCSSRNLSEAAIALEKIRTSGVVQPQEGGECKNSSTQEDDKAAIAVSSAAGAAKDGYQDKKSGNNHNGGKTEKEKPGVVHKQDKEPSTRRTMKELMQLLSEESKKRSAANSVTSPEWTAASKDAVRKRRSSDVGSLTEYEHRIFKYLKARESEFPIPHISHFVDVGKRALLVDWLIYVHLHFKCREETLFIAVSLLDRYLLKVEEQKVQQRKERELLERQQSRFGGSQHGGRNRVASFSNLDLIMGQEELYITGIACFLIASKYEDIHPPKIEQLLQQANLHAEKEQHKNGGRCNVIKKEQILKAEVVILNMVNFDINPGTFSMDFLKRLIRVTKEFDHIVYPQWLKTRDAETQTRDFQIAKAMMEMLALFLLELAMIDASLFSAHEASSVAVTALVLALKIFDFPLPEDLKIALKREISDAKSLVKPEIMNSMRNIWDASGRENFLYSNLPRKFRTDTYFSIAKWTLILKDAMHMRETKEKEEIAKAESIQQKKVASSSKQHHSTISSAASPEQQIRSASKCNDEDDDVYPPRDVHVVHSRPGSKSSTTSSSTGGKKKKRMSKPTTDHSTNSLARTSNQNTCSPETSSQSEYSVSAMGSSSSENNHSRRVSRVDGGISMSPDEPMVEQGSNANAIGAVKATFASTAVVGVAGAGTSKPRDIHPPGKFGTARLSSMSTGSACSPPEAHH
ncbi:unnamed protein product [Amoebophrya sp. A120]|nr:unnamed protein product [Amoebophrya sp. A120]|eukprot:GSA120T00007510001.1